MKIQVDTETKRVTVEDGSETKEHDLFSAEAFSALSRVWVKSGWGLKYSYGFTWLGRPMIQLPEDVLRIQEVIYQVKPDVIVETGVAHGGSLIFYASLFKAIGKGRVIGVDISIRPNNRAAIESHEVASSISLIEGSSIDPKTVAQVRALIGPTERVLVILDSNHTKAHVAAELEAYAPLVALSSYIVATDGIMGDLEDAPGGQPGWRHDNPTEAAREFSESHPEFRLETPAAIFDERQTKEVVTYWPGAYLRRVR
jgi:cephalosporin hydroxylase